MNIENIIKQFNYDETLANFLRELYPEFINYLGKDKEPIIYEALLNTPIVLCNNVYTALKKANLLDTDDSSLVSNADLKRASGVYQSTPIVKYNPETNTYYISEIKRLVAINAQDFTSEFSKTTLIHELSHLIKSYYEECTITNDILTIRSGLITIIEKLTVENGHVKKTLISEQSIGLEEGLTSLMEEEIGKKLVNPNFEIHGYGVLNVIAHNLCEKFNLKDIILNAEVLNKKDELITVLDSIMPDAYAKLDDITTKVYELSLKIFAEVYNPEKRKQIKAEFMELIENEYGPLIKSFHDHQNKTL